MPGLRVGRQHVRAGGDELGQLVVGPLKDNKGVARVKVGEHFPLTDLRKMD